MKITQFTELLQFLELFLIDTVSEKHVWLLLLLPWLQGDLLKWQDSRSLFLSDVKQFWENKLSTEDLIRTYPGLRDRLFNNRYK